MSDCKHHWQTFTPFKARCKRCGVATPWVDLLADADTRTARLVRSLQSLAVIAKDALELRKKAESDGAACIAYWNAAEKHLDAILSVLVEAKVVLL